jgi:hypothetical protein
MCFDVEFIAALVRELETRCFLLGVSLDSAGISGLLSEDKFLPIRYCPVQLDFELVGLASDALQGDVAGYSGRSE